MAGRKVTFDESLALKLYHEHKTDSEIGKPLGKTAWTIASWRKRRNLPSISIDPRKSGDIKCTYHRNHDSYKNALTPEQAIEMNQFLRVLSAAARKAKAAGVQPDIDRFLKAWRGVPISEAGKRERHRMYQLYYTQRQRAKKVRISV